MDTYLIRSLMLGSDEFLFKCILLIYEHQSGTEQDTMSTNEENDQGFNKADAYYMTKMAECIKSSFPLTLSELVYARQRMKKYTTQLSNYLTEEDLLL